MSTQSGGCLAASVGAEAWTDMMDSDNARVSQNNVKKSWAAVLGTGLPQREDRNVLEVVLEKDSRGPFIVTDSKCFTLTRKLGLDQRPGVHVLGTQICPQGRGVIYFVLKENIDIMNFCQHEVFVVTSSGTRVINVKPAGKKEIIVTLKGVHPNTKDEVVVDYLTKFGKVSSNRIVYGTFSDGPLKGFKNGDRSLKVELKPGTNIGSYHFLDGQKISLRYPGQQQTCARCHKTARECRGRAMAKKCESEGGLKVDFTDYILDLWKQIGYAPESANLEKLDQFDELVQQVGGFFTPNKPSNSNASKYSGVAIKGFSRETDHGAIFEFLIKSGLPENKRDFVAISPSANVLIENLANLECLDLIGSIHGKKFEDRTLFCNGVIPLTPTKNSLENIEPEACLVNSQVSQPDIQPSSESSLASHGSSSSAILETELSREKFDPIPKVNLEVLSKTLFPENELVARRHSISLCNRTPPSKSLAAEILENRSNFTESSKNILSSMLDLQEVLSEYNSAREERSDTEVSSENESLKNESANFSPGKVKKKKKKRKLVDISPVDNVANKKTDLKDSPPSAKLD